MIYFRHNDAEDLKRVLEKVDKEDKKLKRDVTKQRRFIVTEALFKADGEFKRSDGEEELEFRQRGGVGV